MSDQPRIEPCASATSRDDPFAVDTAYPTFGFLLHDVSRLMRRRFEQLSRHLGLTRAQWQSMMYLSKQEGCHQRALAEALEWEPITLARVIDRLEDAGFVERRPDEKDRRAWRLYLTPAAAPVLQEMRTLFLATKREASAGLTSADIAEGQRILAIMKTNLSDALSRPSQTPSDDSHE
jgi:DNA-binding MarR family transcriptional regulator